MVDCLRGQSRLGPLVSSLAGLPSSFTVLSNLLMGTSNRRLADRAQVICTYLEKFLCLNVTTS